ncbi:transglycosylase SLT domain-containing protein [Azohydromonas caseinilytica]|uniref:Transglycosylase SLT domain-containing protein n=1 Tax=Azohydromonas caseinilytica TaxID=2728836 RepID=A0A848F1P4_9BURK|nr:transglycosylase SLT domain-containing protein [Azohydromonas caseinilytica]NML13604.1 transglycosylase SLT domain-containing protein [Azohydromonas caseinilytica]
MHHPVLKRCAAAVVLLLSGAAALAAVPREDAEARLKMALMLRADAERYEKGDGVPRDEPFAAAMYCRAARAGDAESQFRLGWIYAYGRGVPRNDAWAAHLFKLAAAKGIPQGTEMLRMMGGVAPEEPDCMVPPAPPPAVITMINGVPSRPGLVADPTKRARLLKVAPKQVVAMVNKLAPQYQIKPELALAIMQAESGFNPAAVSPKNAQGLMQLIPATAERFNVRDPFDPVQNVRGGLAYLRWLLAYFEGDLQLVAAAYNAGEGTVDRHLGVPPYEETRGYVAKVLEAAGITDHPYDAKVTRPSPRLEQIRKPRVEAVNYRRGR